MWRVLVRSHTGNVVLAAVGAFYAVGALAVLVWFISDVWNAASTIDYLLQAALLGALACGLWFLYVALENLGVSLGHRAGATSNPASVHR